MGQNLDSFKRKTENWRKIINVCRENIKWKQQEEKL